MNGADERQNTQSFISKSQIMDKENNNTSFNYSFLKMGDKSLFAMDFDEIKSKIALIEEHMINCEKKGKFVEAELAKQRLFQLKKIEEKKLVEEIKQNFQRNKELLELEQKIELDNLNETFDIKMKEIMKKFTELEQEIEEKYKIMEEEFREDFEKNFKTTQSGEMIELKKTLEGLLRFKNYSEAHNVQTRINKLTQIEIAKWEMCKESRLNKKLENLKNKKQQELKTTHLKNTQAFNEFRKKRAIELDTLIQKHKNKLKDLELQHKNELVDLNRLKSGSKILGGNASLMISRPLSRISSKMASASVSPVYNKYGSNTSSPTKLNSSKLNTTKNKI